MIRVILHNCAMSYDWTIAALETGVVLEMVAGAVRKFKSVEINRVRIEILN